MIPVLVIALKDAAVEVLRPYSNTSQPLLVNEPLKDNESEVELELIFMVPELVTAAYEYVPSPVDSNEKSPVLTVALALAKSMAPSELNSKVPALVNVYVPPVMSMSMSPALVMVQVP